MVNRRSLLKIFPAIAITQSFTATIYSSTTKTTHLDGERDGYTKCGLIIPSYAVREDVPGSVRCPKCWDIKL